MENIIELKVGDVIRWNRARKYQEVVALFSHKDEDFAVLADHGVSGYDHKEVVSMEYLCSVRPYYNTTCGWNGIVEVNGMTVRGHGGKLMDTPEPVTSKEHKAKCTVIPMGKTDFQKFVNLQRSGKINMTDIITGAALTGMSEEKYTDILWHYDEYKSEEKE